MVASNILEQLKDEHVQVMKLLKAAEKCQESQRSNLLLQIKEELVPHARGEEKTIYSLLKEALDSEQTPRKDLNLTNEAYEEHRVIDGLLVKLESLDTSDEKWPAHLKVLKENIEHHVEEEEGQLFKLIKKHFSESKLKELKTIYMDVKETFVETLPSQAQIRERRPSSAA